MKRTSTAAAFTLALVFGIAICGCESHQRLGAPLSPISYRDLSSRSSDSVGRLRRLVLMPIEMTAYEGRYASAADEQRNAREIASACADYLRQKKGYEIIVIHAEGESWRGDETGLADRDSMQALRETWRTEPVGHHAIATIQRIGRLLTADGVIELRLWERKPWDTADIMRNLALLNYPLIKTLATPNLGAWIFETASGELVSRDERSVIPENPDQSITADDFVPLFLNLDNAVPRQLIAR